MLQQSVGYEMLSRALLSLLSDTKTADQALGFLVALALHNFALSGILDLSQETGYSDIDHRLQDMEPILSTIRHPGAIQAIYTSIPLFKDELASMRRYYIYKLLERLSVHSHRNHAILNSLHLVGPLFDAYCSTASGSDGTESPKPTIPKSERQIVLKLLKRLLELGSTTEEARTMFQLAIKPDESLDSDVLEVLRSGMKTKWPEHFSMEGPSAIVIPQESSRGLPNTGFTFMVHSNKILGLRLRFSLIRVTRFGCGWRNCLLSNLMISFPST